MASIKINGATNGSVTLAAPATGSDVTLTLPGGTGTDGQVIATNGSGSLSFVNPGKILQVVRNTNSVSRETTSTSFVDVTGMTVTITPKKADSNILLIAAGPYNIFFTSSGASNYGYLQITDSSDNAISGVESMEAGLANFSGSNTMQLFFPFVVMAYTTAGSTSSRTYKLRFKTQTAPTTVRLRMGDATGQMYAIEVGA